MWPAMWQTRTQADLGTGISSSWDKIKTARVNLQPSLKICKWPEYSH